VTFDVEDILINAECQISDFDKLIETAIAATTNRLRIANTWAISAACTAPPFNAAIRYQSGSLINFPSTEFEQKNNIWQSTARIATSYAITMPKKFRRFAPNANRSL